MRPRYGGCAITITQCVIATIAPSDHRTWRTRSRSARSAPEAHSSAAPLCSARASATPQTNITWSRQAIIRNTCIREPAPYHNCGAVAQRLVPHLQRRGQRHLPVGAQLDRGLAQRAAVARHCRQHRRPPREARRRPSHRRGPPRCGHRRRRLRIDEGGSVEAFRRIISGPHLGDSPLINENGARRNASTALLYLRRRRRGLRRSLGGAPESPCLPARGAVAGAAELEPAPRRGLGQLELHLHPRPRDRRRHRRRRRGQRRLAPGGEFM